MALSEEDLYVTKPLILACGKAEDGSLSAKGMSQAWSSLQMWLRYLRDQPKRKTGKVRTESTVSTDPQRDLS